MDRYERLIKKLEKLDFSDLEGDGQSACLRERDNQIWQLKRMENHLEALEDPKAADVFIRALADTRTQPTGVRPPEETDYSEWSLKIERVSNGFIVSHEAQEPGCESGNSCWPRSSATRWNWIRFSRLCPIWSPSMARTAAICG